MEAKHCDLLVIGGGGAGLVAAARAAELNPDIHIIGVEKGNATGGGACQAGDFRVYGSQWQKDRGPEIPVYAGLPQERNKQPQMPMMPPSEGDGEKGMPAGMPMPGMRTAIISL